MYLVHWLAASFAKGSPQIFSESVLKDRGVRRNVRKGKKIQNPRNGIEEGKA